MNVSWLVYVIAIFKNFFIACDSISNVSSPLQDADVPSHLCDPRVMANFIGDLFDVQDLEGLRTGVGMSAYAMLLKRTINDLGTITSRPLTKFVDGDILGNISTIFLDAATLVQDTRKDSDKNARIAFASLRKAKVAALQPSRLGIYETDPSKVFFFPCGYSNARKSGHAIYCEVTRMPQINTSDTEVFFRLGLYNTGDGIHYHASVRYGPRRYHQAVLLYERISAKEILNNGFWAALYDLQFAPNEDVEFSSYHLYEVAMNRFNDRIVPAPDAPYAQAQVSGTCVMSGLSAYLRLKLRNELDYLVTFFYTSKAFLLYFTGQCDSQLAASLSTSCFARLFQAQSRNYTKSSSSMEHEQIEADRDLFEHHVFANGTHDNEMLSIGNCSQRLSVSANHPLLQLMATGGKYGTKDFAEPESLRQLLLTFVRYIAWLVGRIQGKHGEYFADARHQGLNLTDAFLQPIYPPPSLPQVFAPEELRRINIELRYLKDIWYHLDLSGPGKYPRLAQLPDQQCSVPTMEKYDAPTRLPLQSHIITDRYLPPAPLGPDHPISLNEINRFLNKTALNDWFNTAHDAEASFVSHCILQLPLDPNIYAYDDVQEVIDVLTSAFYHILYKASLGHGAPFFDYVLALYKIYYLIWKFSCISEERSGIVRPSKLSSLSIPLFSDVVHLERFPAYTNFLVRHLTDIMKDVEATRPKKRRSPELVFKYFGKAANCYSAKEFEYTMPLVGILEGSLKGDNDILAYLKEYGVIYDVSRMTFKNEELLSFGLILAPKKGFVNNPPPQFYLLREIYGGLSYFTSKYSGKEVIQREILAAKYQSIDLTSNFHIYLYINGVECKFNAWTIDHLQNTRLNLVGASNMAKYYFTYYSHGFKENEAIIHEVQNHPKIPHMSEIVMCDDVAPLNILHQIKENRQLLKTNEGQVLLSHILLSSASIQLLSKNETGFYASVYKYLSEEKRLYYLLGDFRLLLFLYALEIRMCSLMGQHEHNSQLMLELWSSINRENAYFTLAVMLLIFDCLPDEYAWTPNTASILLFSHALWLHRKSFEFQEQFDNSSIFADISIVHQCERALNRYSSVQMRSLVNDSLLADVAQQFVSWFSVDKALEKFGHLVCRSKYGVDLLCICQLETGNELEIDLLRGIITGGSISITPNFNCPSNYFMSLLAKRNLFIPTLQEDIVTASAKRDRLITFETALTNSPRYFVNISLNHCTLFREYDGKWYQFMAKEKISKVFPPSFDGLYRGKQISFEDLGLDSLKDFMWMETGSTASTLLFTRLASSEDQELFTLNAKSLVLNIPQQSPFLSLNVSGNSTFILHVPYLCNISLTSLANMPKRLGQLMLFANSTSILRLSYLNSSEGYIVFPEYHRNGMFLRLSFVHQQVMYETQRRRYEVIPYERYEEAPLPDLAHKGLRVIKNSLMPHLVVFDANESNAALKYFILVPSTDPRLADIDDQGQNYGALLINLDSNGLPHISAQQSRLLNIYIAYLFIKYGLLEHAANHLKSVHLLTPLSVVESEYLLRIATFDKWAPNDVFLRIFCAHLIHSNNNWYAESRYQRKQTEGGKLSNLFIHYFAKAHLISHHMRYTTTMHGEKDFGMLDSFEVLHLFAPFVNHFDQSAFSLLKKHYVVQCGDKLDDDVFQLPQNPYIYHLAYDYKKFILGNRSELGFDENCWENSAQSRFFPSVNYFRCLLSRSVYESANQSFFSDTLIDLLNDASCSPDTLALRAFLYDSVSSESASRNELIKFKSDWSSFRFSKYQSPPFSVKYLLEAAPTVHSSLDVITEDLSDLSKFVDLYAPKHLQNSASCEAKSLFLDNIYVKILKDIRVAVANEAITRKNAHRAYTYLSNNIMEYKNFLIPRLNRFEIGIQSIAFDYDRNLHSISSLSEQFLLYFVKKSRDQKVCSSCPLEVLEETAKYLISSVLYSQLGRYLKYQLEDRSFIQFAQENDQPFEALGFVFNINEFPELLLFEYYTGFSVRKDQFKNIMSILSTIQGSDAAKRLSLIIQIIMSGGKTLVLSTNLAMLISHLTTYTPVFISPRALLTQNAQDIHGRVNKFFGMTSTMLTCHRTSLQMSIPVLQWMRYHLISSRHYSSVFFSRPETVQCYQNLMVDILDKGHEKGKEALEVTKMLSFLRKQSVALIDEADNVFSPKSSLNFPKLETKRIDSDLILFTSVIFSYLSSVKHEKIKLRSDYVIRLMPQIVGFAVSLSKNTSMPWHDLFQLNDLDRNAFEDFLLTDAKEAASTSTVLGHVFADSPGKPYEYFVLFLRRLIQDHIFSALTRVPGVHFGLSKNTNIMYAIPYEAANVPKEGSVFSDPWQTICYTFQYFVLHGFSEFQVKTVLKALHDEILDGVQGSQYRLDFRETDAYRLLIMLWEFRPGFEIDNNSVIMVQEKLKSLTGLTLHLVARFAFKPLKLHSKQISNVPLSIANAFATYCGYSGTVDNSYIFLDDSPHAVDTSDGAGIHDYIRARLDAIMPNVLFLPFEILMENWELDQTLKNATICSYRALLDVGAHFRHFRNELVARHILKACFVNSVRRVVYFDEDANRLFLVSQTAHPTIFNGWGIGEDVSDVFLYLDQPHTIGTDVALAWNATALVTSSFFVTETELFQGIMRMRKFLHLDNFNQRIDFLVPPSLLKYINSTQYEVVVDLAKMNSWRKAEGEKTLVADQRVTVAAQTVYRDFMMEAATNNTPLFWASMDHFPRSIYVTDAIREPSHITAVDDPKRDVIKWLHMFSEEVSEFKFSLLEKALANVPSPKPAPELLLWSNTALSASYNLEIPEADLTQEMQQEQEQEQEQDQDQNVEMELDVFVNLYDETAKKYERPFFLIGYVDKIVADRPSMNLIRFRDRLADQYRLLFGGNIWATEDFMRTRTGTESDILGLYGKTPYQVLISVKPGNELEAFLLSVSDIKDILTIGVEHRERTRDLFVYDPVANASIYSMAGLSECMHSNPRLRRLLVEVMIIGGSFYELNLDEWKIDAAEWFEESGPLGLKLYASFLWLRNPSAYSLLSTRPSFHVASSYF